MSIEAEVLKALSIDFPSDAQKSDIRLKINAVQDYMKNAGINDSNLESELGKACVVIGVTDIWNLNAGEIKFSPAFGLILEQLKVKSIE